MARGLLETIQLGATLVVALPVTLLGVELLIEGETLLGSVFLGIAAMAFAFHRYVPDPMDLPGAVAGRAMSPFRRDGEQ